MADIKTLIKDQAGRKFEDMTGQTVSSIRFDPQRSLQSFAQRISARVDPEPSPYVESPRPRVVITTAGFPESTAIPTEPQTPQNWDSAQDGAPGCPGPPGLISMTASTTTTATGSDATATVLNTGTTGMYLLRFGIPRGERGPTGLPGTSPFGFTGVITFPITSASFVSGMLQTFVP